MMKPEQWQQAREVLADALELKPEDRPAFLDRVCSSDNSLRREVERLLSSSGEAQSSFLQSSALRVTLMPGAKLGEYEVQKLIGSGGMGEVYRARDTRLGRDVAIKVLPSFLSQDPDRLRRFEQEARAAAALNHPNILAVFQMGAYEGAPYLVSELLEGGTLREHLVRGPMPLRKAIDCGVQIARGLAAAHEKGIVHRDLKPENLFVTKDGVVMGTVGYMSPEQVCGNAADHRADIFAFGAILYEMLAGKRAFQKPTSAETMSAILNEDPPGISQIVPNLPPGLQRVAHRCLEKNPEQRFQSASDLAFALEALSDSTGSGASLAPVKSRRSSRWGGAALVLVAVAMLVATMVWLRRPVKTSENSAWVQITNLPDSVSQPALSPDGRMLSFIRGGGLFAGTFASPGQVFVKMLPDGEPAQLTHDDLQKMSPAFSPDGGRIAYTVVSAENRWDTWSVPLLGGQPRLWLPNASGLVWSGTGKILFSEIKNNDIHMAIEAAYESRAGERDVYVPSGDRGMAHRSYPSPDGKWVLLAEMDRGLWLPCRLAPMDGSSAGRQVGPPTAACTSAGWSPDEKWMYLTSNVGGTFHIWRQPFPVGQPEQITSGPTEEEGIAMAADGHSFITAVGISQSSVWVHDASGDRQVSLEGYNYDPEFTPDGKSLCYRRAKGVPTGSAPSELMVADMNSGALEPLLAGVSVVGPPGHAYDISPDGRWVVVAAPDRESAKQLWLAPLDLHLPPQQIPNVEGENPLFASNSEILFRGIEGFSAFVYSVQKDGTGLRKVVEAPVAALEGISPNGQWLVVRLPGAKGASTTAFPLHGGSPICVIAPGVGADHAVRWSLDGRSIFIVLLERNLVYAQTYALPLPRGRWLPQSPVDGFTREADMTKTSGGREIPSYAAPGPTSGTYAFVRSTVQRNLFRVPLP
jgi:eukaryotic-like serine/threonine-protein kinase